MRYRYRLRREYYKVFRCSSVCVNSSILCAKYCDVVLSEFYCAELPSFVRSNRWKVSSDASTPYNFYKRHHKNVLHSHIHIVRQCATCGCRVKCHGLRRAYCLLLFWFSTWQFVLSWNESSTTRVFAGVTRNRSSVDNKYELVFNTYAAFFLLLVWVTAWQIRQISGFRSAT